MLMRSLCTGLLALLAWLPVGHAQSWALRGNPREPALAATSALDIAADSPSRLDGGQSFRVRSLDGASFAGAVVLSFAGATRPLARRGTRRHPPIVRAKRLTIPHDATAPPTRQS